MYTRKVGMRTADLSIARAVHQAQGLFCVLPFFCLGMFSLLFHIFYPCHMRGDVIRVVRVGRDKHLRLCRERGFFLWNEWWALVLDTYAFGPAYGGRHLPT